MSSVEELFVIEESFQNHLGLYWHWSFFQLVSFFIGQAVYFTKKVKLCP